MRIEQLVMGLSSGFLLLAGAAYLVAPDVLVGHIGIHSGAEGLADIRATYGGSQIALGLVLIWCLTREDRNEFGLVLMLLAMLSISLSRGLGILLGDVFSGPNLVGFFFELANAGVFALLLNRFRKRSHSI